jgi:metal-dependent HD superfamily phosphatase/phosphodiesterase
VRIDPGEVKPIRLCIELSNSAGVFQLDQLLRNKLAGSGLEELIEVEATIEGETEKRLMTSFRI